MAVSLPKFNWWPWSSKEKEGGSNGSQLNSSTDWGFGYRDVDNVKFSMPSRARIASSTRKVKRKWQSREERKIDTEYDVVLVPSDGVGLSGSESDDSDWSIGWLEPHAPDFQSDDDSDGSFAVLVPCYKNDCMEAQKGPKVQFFGALKNMPNEDDGLVNFVAVMVLVFIFWISSQ